MVDFSEFTRAILSKSKMGRLPQNAFADDLETFLSEISLFQSIAVRETRNKADMFAATVTVGEAATSLTEVATLLQHAWVEASYPEFQASALEMYRDAIVMRFITCSGDGQFVFTGTITATGPTYSKLRAKFAREFYTLPERT